MKQSFPEFLRVRQVLATPTLMDIPAAVAAELDSLRLPLAGRRIAVTAGSRGIANIAQITRCIVDYVKTHGGMPFIVPAMGSHGGATAEGQREVLRHYGISEETMDCPVEATMETVLLGRTETGAPVHFDKAAYESDGIIVCNRVKPHTDFVAPNESGVVKMVAIGLGNETGCTAIHAQGLAESIPLSCKLSLEKAPILCGLGIVENSRDETCLIRAIPKERFLETDAELQILARKLAPSLPTDKLDLLVVKEIGKIYSGTGMDTKVIGRIRIDGVAEPERPRIRYIAALRMNEHSYGNALGIGLADITTKAMVEQIDRKATYSNLLPTTYLERGKIPVWFDTEQEALETALRLCGGGERGIAVIENTLHMETLLVSRAVYEAERDHLEVLEEHVELRFDEEGRLLN